MSKVSELVRFRFASCFAFDLKNCRLFCLHCNFWRKGAPNIESNSEINNSNLVNFYKEEKNGLAHNLSNSRRMMPRVSAVLWQLHALLNSRRNCRGTISQTCFVMKFIGAY